MHITTEETDEGIAIQFNPELDSGLKEYSEKSLKKSSEFMKYSSLKIWTDYKLSADDKYKQYGQYENDPKHALKEAKNIVEKLKKINTPDYFQVQHSEEESFFLFNHSIPAYVCSILLRDHTEELTSSHP